jgi:hypothetical protein
VRSVEIIAYDPLTQTFPSTTYSNVSGTPFRYRWNVEGDNVTHWSETDKYTGKFSADGKTLSGGWRPIEGSEGITYDAVMTRAD